MCATSAARCAAALAETSIPICAVADFLFAAVNVRMTGDVPVLLFEHNVEYLIWQRLAHLETQPVEARALRDGVAEAARVRSGCLPASRPDRLRSRTMTSSGSRSLAPGSALRPIPTGVDTELLRAARRRRSAGAARVQRLDGLASERRRGLLLRRHDPSAHPR